MIDLRGIVTEIRAEQAGAQRATAEALEHARRLGNRLSRARAVVPSDEWPSWLAEHLPDFPPAVAHGYMLIAGDSTAVQPSRSATRAQAEALRDDLWRSFGWVVARGIRLLPSQVRASMCLWTSRPGSRERASA